MQKIKIQTFKKANLKAELAFPYEVKKCPAQKVGHWGWLFWQNSEECVSQLQKTKIDPNFRPTVV